MNTKKKESKKFYIDTLLGDKIDIHTHLLPGYLDAEQRMKADELLGVSKCLILSTATSGATMPSMTSEEASLLTQKYPDHFAWMCNIEPDESKEFYNKLKAYKEMGAVGLGEFTSRIRFDSPKMDALLDCLEELELPLLFHMAPEDNNRYYGVIDDPGLPGLERALKNHPKLIIIGHSQPFWYELAQETEMSAQARNGFPTGLVTEGRVAQLMRKYPNLYCDLSANSGGGAMMRDPVYAINFMTEFQDRLMFGTDWVGGVMRFGLGGWLDWLAITKQLDMTVYSKICRENAERVYHL